MYQRTQQIEVLPDRTTKIFRTGPNGPGPDLPEKECDETSQTTRHILTMLNADLSFYKVLIVSKI